MLRTAIAPACEPRLHHAGTGPSAAGAVVCCGAGTWLTQRRVVDFGRVCAMRCR
ncbi:hypothetical protein [Streptomyces ochraceiscleroticus]|uniref:Uncharacterized protein n=1 Tax=Streptomyces ochraceiscleroticus TaxID=47761 RepID=A0ABW1MJG4_9ACTN|nr:hypothetical protein [Streptomyces ochraceiscleroticus]